MINLQIELNNLLNKPVTVHQRFFLILLLLAWGDIAIFSLKSLILGYSVYNNFHFFLSSIIIFSVFVTLDQKSLNNFISVLIIEIKKNITLPDWLNETLESSPSKIAASKCFLIMFYSLFDTSFILAQMIVSLFDNITLYKQIHILISISIFISMFISLLIFHEQINIYNNLKNYKPFTTINKLKKNPIIVEQHPFHILAASILPFLTAFFTFDLLFFTVKYLHNGLTSYINLHLNLSVICLLSTLGYWFFSIHKEANEGYHTKKVRWNLLHGVMLFILSEVMLFFSIFWAFFHSSMSPTVAIYCVWPPLGIEIINPWALPFLNTVILLSSGVSLTFSHRALLEGNYQSVSTGLLVTLFYGFLFTGIQLYEYLHAPFSINDSIYGSIFFLATGFHGLHVIIGSLMLLVTLIRNGLRQIVSTQHVGFIASAWYWHFVDVVWLFLFLSIYWWGS